MLAKITGPTPTRKDLNALLAAMVACGLADPKEAVRLRYRDEHSMDLRDPLPVFVLKVDAQLHPSSTAGHFHLYLEQEMMWEKYADLLSALRDAEIIGRDFHDMCMRWHCSFLLKPEFTKSDLNVKFERF